MSALNFVDQSRPPSNPVNHVPEQGCLGQIIHAVIACTRSLFSAIGAFFCWIFNSREEARPPVPFVPAGVEELVFDLSQVEKICPVLTNGEQQMLFTAWALWGGAVGDALGIGPEFLSKEAATKLIYAHPEFGYEHVVRAGFPKRSWSDDTDQGIDLVRAVFQKTVQNHGLPSEIIYARRLYNWHQNGLDGFGGFAPRNNPRCRGIGRQTLALLQRRDFTTNPIQASRHVWATLPGAERPAANGSVMRTAPVGVLYFSDPAQCVKEAIRFGKVTHSDPRCVTATVVVSLAVALLMRGFQDKVEDLVQTVRGIAQQVFLQEVSQDWIGALANPAQWAEIENYLSASSWDELDLDEGGRIGYTLKTMASGFVALRRLEQEFAEGRGEKAFETVMLELLAEGGDADTNASAAGPMMALYCGHRLGKNPIPERWQQLEQHDQIVLRETCNRAEQIQRKLQQAPQ